MISIEDTYKELGKHQSLYTSEEEEGHNPKNKSMTIIEEESLEESQAFLQMQSQTSLKLMSQAKRQSDINKKQPSLAQSHSSQPMKESYETFGGENQTI